MAGEIDTRRDAGSFYLGGNCVRTATVISRQDAGTVSLVANSVRTESVDGREDAGEYYPGGKLVPRKPVTEAGDMHHSEFASLDPEESSLADVINKLKGNN